MPAFPYSCVLGSVNLAGAFNWLIRTAITSEANMSCVERMQHYVALAPEEASLNAPQKDAGVAAPEKGPLVCGCASARDTLTCFRDTGTQS